MNAKWLTVRLGEVLKQRKEFISIEDLKSYKRPRVQLHVKGVVLRDEVDGALIKTKQQQTCRAGEFLVAEIDAKVGGFGIIPDALDGAIVSSHYFLFVVDKAKLDLRFLDYFVRTPAFCDQVAAQGSTNYAAIRPTDVLNYEIPLPPLTEQKRIVARIEELSAQVHEAQVLRQQAGAETQALLPSLLHSIFVNSASWQRMSMEQAIEIKDKQVDPTTPEYSRLLHVSGDNMESGTCQLLPCRTAEVDSVKSSNYLFSPGTILYSKIRPYLRKAVFTDFQGVCSADIYPIHVKSPELDLHFVKWTLVAEPFTNYANRLSGRTRMPKLNRRQLFGFPFSYPPMPKQHEIVAELETLQLEVGALKSLQAETAVEVDALTPSILDRAFKGEL